MKKIVTHAQILTNHKNPNNLRSNLCKIEVFSPGNLRKKQTYFLTGGSITVPHLLQVLRSVLPQNFSMTGGNCLTISFTNKTSSCSLFPQFSQNHMKASFSSSSSSLTFSITRPT